MELVVPTKQHKIAFDAILLFMDEHASSDKTQEARWEAFGDSVEELAGAVVTGDNEGFSAAWSEMGQIAKGLNHEAFLNAYHLPKDSGEYALGLKAILDRIPDGWGRWISCGPGWYSLLVELDRALALLFPDYTVEQAKEKYGQLRYYYSVGEYITRPNDSKPEYPLDKGEEAIARWSKENSAWRRRRERYLKTKAGVARQTELAVRGIRAEGLVRAAEEKAAVTCEECGKKGTLRMTQAPSPWYKTLCDACLSDHGYILPAQYDAWWKIEEPRYLAERRARIRKDTAKRKILFCCSDSTLKLAVPVTCASTPSEVRRLIGGEWDEIWFDDLPAGKAAVRWLEDRYSEESDRVKKEQGYASGYFHLPGAPQTCSIGFFQSTGRLLDIGISISVPWLGELVTDEEAYAAFCARQRRRDKAWWSAREKENARRASK